MNSEQKHREIYYFERGI